MTRVEEGTGFGWRRIVELYAARVIGLSLGVALTVCSARLLGPEGQGDVASLKTLVLLATQIGNVGLSSAFTILFARRPHRIRRYRSILWVYPLGMAMLLSIGCITAGALGSVGARSSFLVFFVAWVPLQLLVLHQASAFVAGHDSKALGLQELLGRAAALLLGLVALVIFGRRVEAFVAALVLSDVLVVAMGWRLLGRLAPPPPRPIRRSAIPFLAAGLRLGVRAWPVLLIPFLLIRSDLLIVRVLRGAREAGIYSIAGQFIDLALVLPVTITTLILPAIVQASQPAEAVRVAFRPTALVLAGLSISAAAGGWFVVRAVFGESYAGAYPALLLLLPGFVCLGLEGLLAQYFAAKGYPAVIALSWLLALGLNVSLNVLFVPRFGFLAAAATSSIAYSVIFALLAVRFRKETGLGIHDLLSRNPRAA